MAGYDEILKAADMALADQQEMERALNSKINEIKDKEWKAPLTPAQREDLQQLREAKAALLASMEELAFVTVGALDRTDEVKRLSNAIRGARKTLESELEDIRHIQSVAGTIAKVMGGLSDVQGKLGDLVKNA